MGQSALCVPAGIYQEVSTRLTNSALHEPPSHANLFQVNDINFRQKLSLINSCVLTLRDSKRFKRLPLVLCQSCGWFTNTGCMFYEPWIGREPKKAWAQGDCYLCNTPQFMQRVSSAGDNQDPPPTACFIFIVAALQN